MGFIFLNVDRIFIEQFFLCPVKDDFAATEKLTQKGSKLSPQQAQQLEKQVEKNPNDVSGRIELLGYYSMRSLKSKPVRKLYGEQTLWMIENHPEISVSVFLSSSSDGKVFDQAKELWIKQADKNQKNIKIVGNAARFFAMANILAKNGLAEKYLKKCVDLDPKNPGWHNWLSILYRQVKSKSEDEKRSFKKKALDEVEIAIQLSKDDARTGLLDSACETAFEAGDFKKTKNYAEEFLGQAKIFDRKKKFEYGDNILSVNIVLGKMALKSGDLKKADEYLLAAGRILGSKTVKYTGIDTDLAEELLAKGEKDSVIQYFQECSKFWKNDEGLLKKWIAMVKNGEKPQFDEKYFLDPSLKDYRATMFVKWTDIKEGLHWLSYTEAETELKKRNKPILYDFSAEWCGPCKALKKAVFGEKKTAEWINKSFIPCLALDRKEEEGKNPPVLANLDKKYQIKAFPTLVIQFPDGTFKSNVGYGSKDEILRFLKDGLAELKKTTK